MLKEAQAESVLSQLGNGDSRHDDNWKLVTSGKRNFGVFCCVGGQILEEVANRAFVESPSFEIFKAQQDKIVSTLL